MYFNLTFKATLFENNEKYISESLIYNKDLQNKVITHFQQTNNLPHVGTLAEMKHENQTGEFWNCI